ALPLLSWIRSEYVKADSEYADAGAFARTHTFVVRIRLVPASRLSLEGARRGLQQWLAPVALRADNQLPLASFKPQSTIVPDQAPDNLSNKLSILLMSEGYRQSEMTKFFNEAGSGNLALFI